jgi:hypothetical protein
MKAFVATILLLLHAQSASAASCADLNRQALPNKAALQVATDEYRGSAVSHLRDMLNDKDPPPINAISEGIAETSKMISAMDKFISYLRSVKDTGCFGKDTDAWSAAIIKMEAQLDGMRKDRATYIEILSMMSKVEDRPRK